MFECVIHFYVVSLDGRASAAAAAFLFAVRDLC